MFSTDFSILLLWPTEYNCWKLEDWMKKHLRQIGNKWFKQRGFKKIWELEKAWCNWTRHDSDDDNFKMLRRYFFNNKSISFYEWYTIKLGMKHFYSDFCSHMGKNSSTNLQWRKLKSRVIRKSNYCKLKQDIEWQLHVKWKHAVS